VFDTIAGIKTCALFPIFLWIAAGQNKPPRVLQKVDPEYTDLARTVGVQGSTLVGIAVDADGKPTNLHTIRSIGFGLDEKAIEGVT